MILAYLQTFLDFRVHAHVLSCANFRGPMAMLQLPIHHVSILKSGVHDFRHRIFMCYHFQLVFWTFFLIMQWLNPKPSSTKNLSVISDLLTEKFPNLEHRQSCPFSGVIMVAAMDHPPRAQSQRSPCRNSFTSKPRRRACHPVALSRTTDQMYFQRQQ